MESPVFARAARRRRPRIRAIGFVGFVALFAPPATAAAEGLSWSPLVPVELPAVTGNGEVVADAPWIWVGRDRLGVERRDELGRWTRTPEVLRLDDARVGPADKGGDAHGFLIEPLRAALRGSAGKGGVVNVMVDGAVPYRTVTEVLYTAGQAGLLEYHLGVSARAQSATVVYAPRVASGPAKDDPGRPPLNLTLAIDGGRRVHLAAGAADIGALIGCDPAAGEAACSIAAGARAPLYNQAVAIKRRFPETFSVQIAAAADVPWRDVLSVAAAVRARREKERYGDEATFAAAPPRSAGAGVDLFPAVILAVAE